MRLSRGLMVPGNLNLEVTLCLLACWVLALLLCLEGDQVNRQCTAGSDDGAGTALPGLGVHLPGNTAAKGGDCIKDCTSVCPLIPTPWLESPLGPPNPRPAAFAHPPSGGVAPVMVDPSLWVGHPCSTFSPTQFLSILSLSQF